LEFFLFKRFYSSTKNAFSRRTDAVQILEMAIRIRANCMLNICIDARTPFRRAREKTLDPISTCYVPASYTFLYVFIWNPQRTIKLPSLVILGITHNLHTACIRHIIGYTISCLNVLVCAHIRSALLQYMLNHYY